MKPYKTITLRLNAAEYAHLRKQTEATGLKMEPLLRQLILGVNLRPRPPDEYAALLRELAKESGYFDFFKRRPFFIRPISKRPAKPSVPVRSLRCWKPNSGRGSTPTVMWSPR